MHLNTIENFLNREDVFTWVDGEYLDIPDEIADEFVALAIRESGFDFLISALHTQAYCETFAADLVQALQSGRLFDIAMFHERAIEALRGYARYVLDCNADIAVAAYKKFQRQYEEGEIQNAKILEFKPF